MKSVTMIVLTQTIRLNADEEVHGTGWLVLLHIQPAYCLPKNVTER
jgi:hypothetical protein